MLQLISPTTRLPTSLQNEWQMNHCPFFRPAGIKGWEDTLVAAKPTRLRQPATSTHSGLQLQDSTTPTNSWPSTWLKPGT